ncbi:hypothetical protein [Robertkochia aurantiaca]|uniref:hypothetical protein n=1 Tax=Robertkochia aurantiaca TaxID=2873700 RepID=UPI001CCFCEF4|nr:hypothetical protein [Robertkochia sp. 3YJGBD-33]
MKKYLTDIIWFLIGFAVVNLVFLFAVSRVDWNFKKRLQSLNLDSPEYDYLILGNSYALDGIDAELLSSDKNKAYNMAIGGTSVRTNFIQLKEYIRSYDTRPEKVILALDGFRHDFKSDVVHPIVEFTTDDYQYTFQDLPLIKFRWMFIEMIKKVISSEHRNAELVQGQLRLAKTISDKTNLPEVPKKLPFKNFKSSPWIQKIDSLCVVNDIELVLLEMPAVKGKRNDTPVGPHEIRLDNGNLVKLFNFNSIDFNFGQDPTTDWIGNSHLNETGARKFTRKIKEVMAL